MPVTINHLILNVKDAAESAEFYSRVLGFRDEGRDGPFSVLRVSPEFTLQLAPRGTAGGEHLAFAMDGANFESAFARIRETGIPFGDGFSTVGSMKGPGIESGARGMGKAVYLFDPNKHLIEIRTYASDR